MKTFQSTLEHWDALSNQGSDLAIHVTQARQLPCSLKCICSFEEISKIKLFFFFLSSMNYRAFKSTFDHPLSRGFSQRPSSWVARQAAQLENHPMIESAEDETSCDRKLPCDRKNVIFPVSTQWSFVRAMTSQHIARRLCYLWTPLPPTLRTATLVSLGDGEGFVSSFLPWVRFWAPKGPVFTGNLPGVADVTRCQSRQREMTVAHRDAEEEMMKPRWIAMKPNFHTNYMETLDIL